MRTLLVIFAMAVLVACNGQSTSSGIVGGACEGCEAVHEYGNQTLTSEIILPNYDLGEEKLHVQGIIYKLDGKSPASNVILYIYHTDPEGHYPTQPDAQGWARRHGYLRGWLKTDSEGRYSFKTIRPATYPNTTVPQHIHATVKEPGKNEYFIDDFFFHDDPHLPANIRNPEGKRGGSGVLKLTKEEGIWKGSRNIILGKNIPNYPK